MRRSRAFFRAQKKADDLEDTPTFTSSASWPLLRSSSLLDPLDPLPDPVESPCTGHRFRFFFYRLVVICMLSILLSCFLLYMIVEQLDPALPLNEALQLFSENGRPPITRGWYPPAVDRYILEKLELLSRLEADLEPGEDDNYPSSEHNAGYPVINRIPESGNRGRSRQQAFLSVSKNACMSSSTSCQKFLLPSWVGEQESKARLHILQLVQLAKELNRTLILPNVSRGRMSSCMKSNIELYYDTTPLTNTLSFEEFSKTASSISGGLSASIVMIDPKSPGRAFSPLQNSQPEHLYVFTDKFGDPSKSKHNHCLKEKIPALRFRSFSPLWLFPRGTEWHHDAAASNLLGKELVEVLTSSEVLSDIHREAHAGLAINDPDVIVVSWDLRYPLFQVAEEHHLSYASLWSILATNIAMSLSPVIAIHWRMETIELSVLGSCTSSLISVLKDSLSQPGNNDVDTVYLATDYPLWSPSRPRSSTFGTVKQEQLQAIAHLTAAFEENGELSKWHLVYLERALEKQLGESKRWKGISLEDLDLGLAGILDKNIAIQAELFVSASEHCGKASSYTRQIIHARSMTPNTHIRNIVSHFGL